MLIFLLLVTVFCLDEDRIISSTNDIQCDSHTIYETSAELCDLIAEVFTLTDKAIYSYRYGLSNLFEVDIDSATKDKYIEARGCVFKRALGGEFNGEMVTLLPSEDIYYCISESRDTKEIVYLCTDSKRNLSRRLDTLDKENGKYYIRWLMRKSKLPITLQFA